MPLYDTAMTQTTEPTTAWRSWRLTIPGLSMNEVARRSGVPSGRLSIIERGVPPTDAEATSLRAVLVAASTPKEGAA
jgi:hypothetical protein